MDPEGVSVLIQSISIVSFVDYYCGLYEAQPDAPSLKKAIKCNIYLRHNENPSLLEDLHDVEVIPSEIGKRGKH